MNKVFEPYLKEIGETQFKYTKTNLSSTYKCNFLGADNKQ